MESYFIWGMGLLGTSLAFELREKGYHVFGCDESIQNIKFLSTIGFTHVFSNDDKIKLNNIISKCDGIIIATPITSVYKILEEITHLSLKPTAWITDMSSSKTDLINWLNNQQIKIPFVGSHPMTGSDLTGPQNAKQGMFNSTTIYVVESEGLKNLYGDINYDNIVNGVKYFWKGVGAKTYTLSHKQHDRWGAYLSHGLHMISCLTSILIKDIEEVFEVPSIPAGGSFRDITRVSGSNPDLWDGIIQSNSHEVKEYLKRFVSISNEWIKQLESNTINIKDIFIEAQEMREKIIKPNR